MFSPCTILGLKGRQNLGVLPHGKMSFRGATFPFYICPAPPRHVQINGRCTKNIYICQYPLASRLISFNGGGVDVFVKIYLTMMFLAISKQVCFE